jgi:hypothetical protein
MDNTWQLNIRLGWIVGLAIAVVLIGATVGLVVGAVVTPVSLRVFLMGLGACLTLGLALRVIYQLWSLVNASYELDRNALTINWGPVAHQIPMGSVQEVFSGSKLADLHVRPSLRWPGYFVGLGQASAPLSGENEATVKGAVLDPVLFYASGPLEEQVVIRTEGIAYAISPTNLEEFLTALRERLEMGPTQEVQEHSTRPAFLEWPFWRDRWSTFMLSAAVLALVLLVGLLTWRYPYLPPEIALRFTPTGDPLLLGRSSRIFYFATLGAAFVLINGTIGLFFYRRERPLAYFLWSGLLASLGGLWAAVVSILLMNGS